MTIDEQSIYQAAREFAAQFTDTTAYDRARLVNAYTAGIAEGIRIAQQMLEKHQNPGSSPG